MSKSAPSLDRLKQIMRRQEQPKFGCNYLPSILATREEAPRISIASQNYSLKLGRAVHALSMPETAAINLALYYPQTIDLHEQKMLMIFPSPHPFSSHSLMRGFEAKGLLGTIAVAERLGLEEHHPMVPVDKERYGCDWMPYPFVGDLLLFLHDEVGPYCVNWNVKAGVGDFEKPLEAVRSSKRQLRAEKKAQARHQIEIAYYQDAEIRTVDFASTEIDQTFNINLNRLRQWSSRPTIENTELRQEVILHFRVGLSRGIPPSEGVMPIIYKTGLSRELCFSALYQAIWARELRVDLFNKLLIDRPLVPEKKDALDEFRTYFSR